MEDICVDSSDKGAVASQLFTSTFIQVNMKSKLNILITRTCGGVMHLLWNFDYVFAVA